MTNTHDILAIALVGAAHGGLATATTASPVDELALPDVEAQRALLLRAGAWASYRRAGRLPLAPAPEPTTPAPAETREPCSVGAHALLSALLQLHTDLLPEALARLNAANLRLPPGLLPLALDRTPAALRPQLLPTLGERGRWLARQNPAWSWAAEPPDDAPLDEAKLLAIWEEGALRERVTALLRLRRIDPERARELLAAVWKREKSEVRVALLKTLEVSLSLEDEPLLTIALADRTEQVRLAAAELLARLPDSSFAQAERRRAASLLTYADGKLDATPPNADAEWLSKAALKSTKPLLLMRALEYIPPDYWEALYQATPEELIAATTGAEFQDGILLGWTEAMVRFAPSAAARWVTPLRRMWASESIDISQTGMSPLDRCALFVTAEERDAYIFEHLARAATSAHSDLRRQLEYLPRPWSAAVATAFLEGLRAFAAGLTGASTDTTPWDECVGVAALALPGSHFAQALEPFTVPETKHWQIAAFRHSLDRFADTIHLRMQIAKEIPL